MRDQDVTVPFMERECGEVAPRGIYFQQLQCGLLHPARTRVSCYDSKLFSHMRRPNSTYLSVFITLFRITPPLLPLLVEQEMAEKAEVQALHAHPRRAQSPCCDCDSRK